MPSSIKKNSVSEQFSAIVPAPFGAMGLRCDAQEIVELVYLPTSFAEKAPTDALSAKLAVQLQTYFADPSFVFDVPVKPIGTAFQQRVWAAISAIPVGEVRTYGQIAKQLQSAPRAVGQACGANWYPLIIPCHRVTASGGLGGFSHHDDPNGFHLNVKRWLLAHEKVAGY